MEAFRQILEWEGTNGRFRLEWTGILAILTTPEGQVLELDLAAWKDLHTALPTLFAIADKGRDASDAPANAGKPWSDEDDETLRSAWEETPSISKLAAHFQRTRGAIQSRLKRLGLIE